MDYMLIHANIIPIHIYTHACTHFHIYTCAYTHSCACVYHFPSVDGKWDGKGVQEPKGFATAHHKRSQIFFVTNGKLRNYNFLNNNILYHLLGGIYGPQKDEHQDARISPQATTSVAIKYGLYVLLLLPC